MYIVVDISNIKPKRRKPETSLLHTTTNIPESPFLKKAHYHNHLFHITHIMMNQYLPSEESSDSESSSSDSGYTRSFTPKQVAEHNTPEDCWVMLHGKVYEVTDYLANHPGGGNLISRNGGKDVTSDFEGMFHSDRARARLKTLYIGDVKVWLLFLFILGV